MGDRRPGTGYRHFRESAIGQSGSSQDRPPADLGLGEHADRSELRHGGSYFNQRAFPDTFRMADNRIQSLMGDWDGAGPGVG